MTKLVPQILDGVETNKCGDEEANPLNTAHATNTNTSQDEPDEPVRTEALIAQLVEPSPAQHSSKGEAQKHGIQEDEAADSGVGVLAEYHERDEPDGGALEVELAGGVVGQRDAHNSEEGVECPHHDVVDFLWVCLAGLELKRSIVSCDESGQADQHLSEGRVYIEVEFALEVVRTEFTEAVVVLLIRGLYHEWTIKGVPLLCFIPSHDWRQANLP